MTKLPQSPQPPGDPRWVAMFYQFSSDTWRVAAESPYRSPVLHALGEMARTVRARGDELSVSLWGPEDGAWRRFDADGEVHPRATPWSHSGPAKEPSKEPSKFVERLHDRRHQVLIAGLSQAGIYDLAPDDVAAVQAMIEQLDEATVRRIALWLAAAGSGSGQ